MEFIKINSNETDPRDWFSLVWKWVLAGLVLFLIGAYYLFGWNRFFTLDSIQDRLADWQGKVQKELPLTLALFFTGYVAVTALSLPAAAILSLLAGALFGRWSGTVIVSLASTLGATLAFLGTRFLFRDSLQKRYDKSLQKIGEGIQHDGPWYLLTLRLVPAIPFFLINMGMALTPISTWTFAGVSWLGMLPGTFLYVNAGTELATLDSVNDLFSPRILGSLALLGLLPLVLRWILRSRVSFRLVLTGLVGILALLVTAGLIRTYFRYQTAAEMMIPVREYLNSEYPEDPANRSQHHGQYNGRSLKLVQKDPVHFDFIFEPQNSHVARVIFRNVDVSLMTPSLPSWTRNDPGLQRIALTDRQWNRQQVRFGTTGASHFEVEGGNGFEVKGLYSAELAKNCLNAGLWEVLLLTNEGGEKAVYYQGWFTFPLGHYQKLFEQNTQLPYRNHWYYLEHWFDPAGTAMNLEGLRTVSDESRVQALFDPEEAIIASGEQIRKRRTVIGENILSWKDFYSGKKIRFATFIPPGRYSVNHPWQNQYRKIRQFDGAIIRSIRTPANEQTYQEIELTFSSPGVDGQYRFIVSGFQLEKLPVLPAKDYSKGMYMPMGIGTPPFYQSWEDLQKNPPSKSPYFSLLLDEKNHWIDHHQFAIDGPVLHRDEKDPSKIHLYLLSYERQTLIGHFIVPMK